MRVVQNLNEQRAKWGQSKKWRNMLDMPKEMNFRNVLLLSLGGSFISMLVFFWGPILMMSDLRAGRGAFTFYVDKK